MSGHRELAWLPWHQAHRQHFETLLNAGRLPHAWLFHGPSGTGKSVYARMLSHGLLCQDARVIEPCGVCHGCQLFLAGHHPDLMVLQADEGKQIIGVDKVRDCVDFMHKTANQGGRRIVIIPRSDHMNVNAANALLKTLEEPPSGVILLLISPQPGLVMATIRSRCQSMLFPVPPRALALSWLQENHPETSVSLPLALANGAPLLALHYADPDWMHAFEKIIESLAMVLSGEESVVRAAQNLNIDKPGVFVEVLMLVVHHLQIRAVSAKHLEPSLEKMLEQLPHSNATGLDSFYRHLISLRRDLQRGLALNTRLAVEDALYRWKKGVNPVGSARIVSG